MLLTKKNAEQRLIVYPFSLMIPKDANTEEIVILVHDVVAELHPSLAGFREHAYTLVELANDPCMPEIFQVGFFFVVVIKRMETKKGCACLVFGVLVRNTNAAAKKNMNV
jgi:hypothetical protein